MANCNCNHKCGTEPVRGCFSSGCPSNRFSTTNCACTPCSSAPVIVETDPDLTNEILVPILANVIQNCMTVDKYETACPADLVFLTSFPLAGPAPSGVVCITGISYSYDCIGVKEQGKAYIDGNTLTLTPTQAACSCGAGPTELYNQFEGSARTTACRCNQTMPPTTERYALRKICETKVKFAACNLNVTIQGTIGGYPFTATLKGTASDYDKNEKFVFTPLCNPTMLSELSFPESLNFAGRMCLPTCTKLNISEEFENCLTIDCIRPTSATYVDPLWEEGHAPAPGYYLMAAGDLSLIINKQIYATTTEKLAVLTTEGSHVVCNNGTSPASTCPQPAQAQCGSTTVPCPSAPEMPEA